MIRSKFRLWCLLPLFLSLFIPALLFTITYYAFKTPIGVALVPFCFVAGLFSFAWTWIVFGELRTKEITITITEDQVNTRNFLGLGHTRSYSFSDFDGFVLSVLPSRQGDYEYLYLIKNNKKLVKLSQFYHRNYAELKQIISRKTRELGFEKFSYRREFKEIFT